MGTLRIINHCNGFVVQPPQSVGSATARAPCIAARPCAVQFGDVQGFIGLVLALLHQTFRWALPLGKSGPDTYQSGNTNVVYYGDRLLALMEVRSWGGDTMCSKAAMRMLARLCTSQTN